ncbi:hypothetical protein, partial [Enterococcus faecium]|uniref:hypothetical protein n=1 Tax=Enterococcus faecium TaxID=1352 RepID=UPI003F43762C
DVYNRYRPIAVQRYEAYWRDWIGLTPEGVPDNTLVAADETGVPQGYLRYGVFRSAVPYNADERQVRVTELGVRADSHADEA